MGEYVSDGISSDPTKCKYSGLFVTKWSNATRHHAGDGAAPPASTSHKESDYEN